MAYRGRNRGQLATPVVKGALGEFLVAAIATDTGVTAPNGNLCTLSPENYLAKSSGRRRGRNCPLATFRLNFQT